MDNTNSITCIRSLVPRPPPFLFFSLRFSTQFSIINGSGRAAKNREGLGTLIT